MNSTLIIYSIGIGIIALLVALFQYVYKSKRNNVNKILAVFRFFTVFAILLLLVNPKVEQKTVFVERPNLVVAIDNSESIAHLNQSENVSTVLQAIQSSTELNNNFNISYYNIGESLSILDSVSYNEKETNINKGLKELSQVYKNSVSPTILVTDGNQTYGSDYQFASQFYKQPIYPIILGDTITHSDLKIAQLNVNKYAYLKNRFPVEVLLNYNGHESLESDFKVFSGNAVVFSKRIRFSKTDNAETVNFTLPANSVGVKTYSTLIEPVVSEKNTVNNSRNFAVEVIDQKQRIAIVSSFLHPDLGAIKKSLESNEQREVLIMSLSECLSQLNDIQLIIIYQPDNSFKTLYDQLIAEDKNSLTIIGSKTVLTSLNTWKEAFKIEVTNQTENYQGFPNTNYSNFLVDDIGFESFPPLLSPYGDIIFSVKPDILLYKKLRNVVTQKPLLATYENDGRREGVLLGENIWQWRAQDYISNSSFTNFDDFLSKVVQYLASSKQKNRLSIDYESFYTGTRNIIIKAQYFNKNYEFDPRETLSISVKSNDSIVKRDVPFILRGSSFQVDLSGLQPNDYEFTVRANSENITVSGNFTVLEYNVEQQFLNADVTKLSQLATNTSGKSYFVSQYNDLFQSLIDDTRFVPIQKSTKETVSLIDFKYLLFIIALLLAIEWFIRKYNGLI